MSQSSRSCRNDFGPDFEQLASHRKEEFHKIHKHSYGCQGAVELAREQDLQRLKGVVYLDFAGAVPFSDTQLESSFERLSTNILHNPHSVHEGDELVVETLARQLTLEVLQVPQDEYEVIFTSGATEALRLDNHNSVVGIRELALHNGASAVTGWMRVNAQGVPELVPTSNCWVQKVKSSPHGAHLVAYPLESNFNGARYDPCLVNHIQSKGLVIAPSPLSSDQAEDFGSSTSSPQDWFVLLDAAKACGTSPPNIRQHPADFIALSYYKIFGFPTGLGALVAKKESLAQLKPSYFGGGTLELISSTEDKISRRAGHQGWEHGTLNFLAVASIVDGFKRIQQLGGFREIDMHASCLTEWLSYQLHKLKHENGSRVCHLYHCNPHHGSQQLEPLETWKGVFGTVIGQGPVITFNLLTSTGDWVGYKEVYRLAKMHEIHLRVGRFCNPGAWDLWGNLEPKRSEESEKNGHHLCGDTIDLIDGLPTGAIRVSLGWCSTFDDVSKFLAFVEYYFVESRRRSINSVMEGKRNKSLHRLNDSPHIADSGATWMSAAATGEKQLTADNEALGFVLDEDQFQIDRKKVLHITSHHSNNVRPDNGQFFNRSFTGSMETGSIHSTSDSVQLGVIKSLTVFPVKSCGAQYVESWPLGPSGLLYDRHWAIVDQRGKVMTLWRHPSLALIKPRLDLQHGTLMLSHPNRGDSPAISLGEPPEVHQEESQRRNLALFDSPHQCSSSSLKEVSIWLELVLKIKCSLVACSVHEADGSEESMPRSSQQKNRIENSKGYGNAGGVSLLSTTSLARLTSRLRETGWGDSLDAARFRMNVLVDVEPDTPREEEWGDVMIGSCRFRNLHCCNRCSTIMVNHTTGLKDGKAVFLAVADERCRTGKMSLGVICIPDQGLHLKVGDLVFAGENLVDSICSKTQAAESSSQSLIAWLISSVDFVIKAISI